MSDAWENWLDAPSGDEATNHALAEALTIGCACHDGRTVFNLFEDTCDECCASIIAGAYDEESHGHKPSPEQQAILDEATR